ncbi:GNAT family N-acetyltransferase [Pseudahrensia aquimaris]|uniref:GNAT family N-acetyltransferase n=1 Tax=Pseudahrensia aquimaris TaxID=744461 RepID=A0ABW3FBU6_9HYPH
MGDTEEKDGIDLVTSDYEREWERQWARDDVPVGHLPVHRWYLRMDRPQDVEPLCTPRDDLHLKRIENPSVELYRSLYNGVGEDYLWGDRRVWSDERLAAAIAPETIHLVVLQVGGETAGYFELDFANEASTNINYFGLLPDFVGGGLGRYLLNACICYAAQRASVPLTLDTCSLDHPLALQNYLKRGFAVIGHEDLVYPDPRLQGTIKRSAASQIPLARQS